MNDSFLSSLEAALQAYHAAPTNTKAKEVRQAAGDVLQQLRA